MLHSGNSDLTTSKVGKVTYLRVVIAANIMRRHLTTGQRAMTAAALANMTVGRNWESNRANLPDNKSNKDAADEQKSSGSACKSKLGWCCLITS